MSYFLSYLLMFLMEDIANIIFDLSTVGSWEELVALPSFGKIVFYAVILLLVFLSGLLNLIMYRIMRPIALFIMARHAGYPYAWIAFIPYGAYFLEFVLPIREFNVLNCVKTDKRETIAWIYIGNELFGGIVSAIIKCIPLLGQVADWAYSLFFVVWKWRKIYDLLKTFGFNKSAMTWAILGTLWKPLYVVLLFFMCDKEPDYGWKRFECPIILEEGDEEEYSDEDDAFYEDSYI